MRIVVLCVVCVLVFVSEGNNILGFETGWEKPLAEKEAALERNILLRHNILGLYPSMVEIPMDGGPVDPTTATPFSDTVHAVAWTSQYLAGASYRYAWLKENSESSEEIEAARRRADEIFEAVYRCQRVTGRQGLLSRGYFLGFGPTFDERRGASHSDDWHQGHVDGYDFRFCAGPSHHIYSAAVVGMGQYYDLAAEGEQKERAREAVDALVSYWVDNEYIWKGGLHRPNAHTSRIASGVSVSPQNPRVACVVDPAGHLYLSHDGGATAGGWKSISDGLKSPVRAVAFGDKTRVLAVACDDGFYFSSTGGETWSRLSLDYKGSPRAVWIDAQRPEFVYAATDFKIYRSLDYGEGLTGRAWEPLGERLPSGVEYRFHVATGEGKTRIYAVAEADVFSSTGNGHWTHKKLGLGEYGQVKGWLAVDPSHPDQAAFGVRFGGTGLFSLKTVLQETSNGGSSWRANHKELTAAFYAGTLAKRLEEFPAHDFKDLQFVPEGSGESGAAYAVDQGGLLLVRADSDSPWTPVMDGLDIPRVERLFVPLHGDRIYVATPAGLYNLRHGETTWRASNLVMQWRKNERRELGGASFITAYWRGLYFGFLDGVKTHANFDTARSKGWFD